MNMKKIREKYPQYNHLSDEELEQRLAQKSVKTQAIVPAQAEGQLISPQKPLHQYQQKPAQPEFTAAPYLGPLKSLFPTWGTTKLAQEMRNWVSIMDSYRTLQAGELRAQYMERNINIEHALMEAATKNQAMLIQNATENGLTIEAYTQLIVKDKTAELDRELRRLESQLRIEEEKNKAELEIHVDKTKKISTVEFGLEKQRLQYQQQRTLREELTKLHQEREQIKLSTHLLPETKEYRIRLIDDDIFSKEAELDAFRQRPVQEPIRRKP